MDLTALAIAILTALCALVMPLQGLYWLGKRAKSPLEPQSSQWFYDISERLRKQHESLPTVQDKPTYQHLAEVLQKAQQKLDKAFWQWKSARVQNLANVFLCCFLCKILRSQWRPF